ncbi:MAG: SgcJ/EcaC family oxidoreductase [Ilumatobacteraceae bacterium]
MNHAATSPEQLMLMFAERAASGDAAGLIELYEPDGVFEPQIGVVLRGAAEILPALTELAAMRPRIEYTGVPDVVIVDAIAIVSNSWTMTARLPDGSLHREGGVSADVLRRQQDGTWLVLIDQPRGATLTP